jgi:PAS domain S-box-containing protein
MKKTVLKLRTLFIVLSMMAVLSWVIGGYLYYSALSGSSKDLMNKEAEEYAKALRNDIDSYMKWSLLSVKSLAGLKQLKQSLLGGDIDTLAETNAVLDNFRDDLEVSVCYLMDHSGNTIASSNRDEPNSFVGKNYGFRPYFIQAMQGKQSVYMALGVTSKARGIYYSYPVYGRGKETPLGVAVIKASVDPIEKNLRKSFRGIVLLTDPHGVVFVSTRGDWLYHVLWKASLETISKITKTRQFGLGPWNWTGMKLVDGNNAVDGSGNKYRVHQQELTNYPDWHLIYFHSHSEVMEQIIAPLQKSVGAGVLVFLVIFGLIVFFLFIKANSSIIQLKKVEDALKKSEEDLKSIFSVAPTGIGVIYDRMISQVNDQVCEMVGYPRNELIGQNARIFYPSDEDYEYVGREKYRQIEARGTGTVETRFKHKNGKIINVLMSSTPNNPANLAAGVTFTVLDITERKRTEKELRNSEERYREYFEENISGTYISSPEGQLIACNQEYTKIFGFDSIQHAMDTPINKLSVDPDARVKFLDLIKREKRVTGYEPNLKKVDGTPIYLLENSSGVFDEDGNLKHIRGFLLDVTDQKKLETKLLQAQKMEAIGTLAGGIAHDFNNLLFPVLGHTEILLQDIPEASPAYKHLEKIYTGGIRAKELVKQILTFSRQDSIELKTIKLQPIVKEALKFIRSTIPTTIEIKQDISSDCGYVKADFTQIHQIVINLTTNAYHAMQETGGELKVAMKEIQINEYDVINLEAEPGTYVCLSISDTGMGMDKELTKKIFDPFFTTKEKGKGTGMGLSVVHGIVASMNGIIKAYSEPDKGTEFNVYFPVAKMEFKKQDIQISDPIIGGTEKILLVDDEEAIVEIERQLLERLGYQVTSRTASIEILEIFRAAPDKFDMVITDMSMPNMPGDSLAAELIKIRPDIPILLCSGFSEIMSEEKAVSVGIRGFLLNPIVMRDLAQTVREILDKN